MTIAWMEQLRPREGVPARSWEGRVQGTGLYLASLVWPCLLGQPEHLVASSALDLCPFRYLEAVGRLKNEGHRFPRTIHMTFVPGRRNSGRGIFGKGRLC